VTGGTVTGEVVAVDLMAGVWAVLATVLVAAIVAVALIPLIRRSDRMRRCNTPGTMGAHPLGSADEEGVRVCSCGLLSERPGRPAAPRTDTREVRIPDNPAGVLAAATGHPSSLPLEQLPTEESPMLHVVWPPPGR
jgi:hypothetical protein